MVVLFLLAILLSPATQALQRVPVGPQTDHIALGPQLEYLKDPTRGLDLAEVESNARAFQPQDSKVLNFGYTAAGYWVRFQLHNTSDRPLTRYLRFDSRFVDHLDLYLPGKPSGAKILRSGRLVPPPQRPLASREFLFPLKLPPGATQTYYLYADSADTLTIPLYLYSRGGLEKVRVKERGWLTFYQGLVVAMMVFSLFLLILLRDVLYVYYIGAIVLHQGVFFLLFDGLAYPYLGLESPWWSRQGISVVLCLAMLMILQFSRALLNTREEQPRLDRAVVMLQIAAIVVAGLGLFLDYYASIRLANPIASMTALLMWLVGWNSYRKGHPAARYYLLAWTLLILGGIAYSLKSWALIPSNFFTEYGWQIGSAVEAILLSMAIAERINIEARQRLHMENEARRAQQQALETQQKANESLEMAVRERTDELRKANRKLQQLSHTDELTRLHNRRAMKRYMQQWFSRSAHDRKPAGVLLIDIDHFKAVNDTYGHPVGDDCLRVIAERLLDNTRRPLDLVARYGGEEFCVVLPQTEPQATAATAERIRQSIAATPVETRKGALEITVSVGVYNGIPESAADAEIFLAGADKALYRSKEEGRNRVTTT